MKCYQKRLIVLLLAMLLVLTSCASGEGFDSKSINYPVNLDKIIENNQTLKSAAYSGSMENIAQNGYLVMYADLSTGHFVVEDLRSNKLWYSVPENAEDDEIAQGNTRTINMSEIVITVVDIDTNAISTYTSYASCEINETINVQKAENGINVVYDFSEIGIKIPVAYRLLEDSFYVQVNTEKIVEGIENIKLLNISILPVFCAQGMDSSGYFILANGSGSVMNFNTKKIFSSPYTSKLFGEDLAYEKDRDVYLRENYSLPVFGMQSGNNGVLAVAALGAANATVYAHSAGQQSAFNNAYYNFEIRGYQTISIGDKSTWNYKDVVTFEDGAILSGKVGVRYLFLGEDQQGPASMASVYRDYLLSNKNLKQKEIPKTPPVFISMLGAIKRSATLLGFEYEKTESITTFEQAAQIVDLLNQSKVSGIYLIYDNWSKSQLDGKITTKIDPINILGSKKDLSELAQKLKNIGGQLSLNGEFILYSKSGNGYSINMSCIRDINNSSMKVPFYKRNTHFPDNKLPKRAILNAYDSVLSANSFVSQLQSTGITAYVMLGTLSNTVYTDFRPEIGIRRHTNERLVELGMINLSKTVSMIGDNPNAYVLPYISAAVNIPMYDTNFDCLDGSIPFYQMVIHGLLPYSSRPINTYGDPEKEFLKCIEVGSSPSYELVFNSSKYLSTYTIKNYYGASYTKMINIIAEQYERYSELYSKTMSASITGYENVQDGVVKTSYSNGVYTIVNYNSNAVTVDGLTVDAMDFAIVEGV